MCARLVLLVRIRWLTAAQHLVVQFTVTAMPVEAFMHAHMAGAGMVAIFIHMVIMAACTIHGWVLASAFCHMAIILSGGATLIITTAAAFFTNTRMTNTPWLNRRLAPK